MRISNRQKEEIEFFCKQSRSPFIPTENEKEEYILETVHGKKVSTMHLMNRISESKRGFDITIKIWKDDLINGLLSIDELYEDFGDDPFGRKLIDSVLNSLNFSNYKPNQGSPIISAINLMRQKDKKS